MVGLAQQMIGIGFIVANWVGYGCQYLEGNTQWRLPLGLQLAPALLLLLGSFFMPQSPRWLLEHGRDEEALAVVRKLHGTTPEAQRAADEEFVEMQTTIKAELVVRSRSRRLEANEVRLSTPTCPLGSVFMTSATASGLSLGIGTLHTLASLCTYYAY